MPQDPTPPTYQLYFGYPPQFSSAEMDERIERAVRRERTGSGMGLDQRDIDFTMDSMEACHRAVHALVEIMPQGSTVWIFRNLPDECFDPEKLDLVLDTIDFHEFKAQLDASSLQQKTTPTQHKKRKTRL